MNKNRRSYSNIISSDSGISDSGTSAYVEDSKPYDSGKSKKEDDSHNAFDKSDYSTRKMTFGKIKYVQK